MLTSWWSLMTTKGQEALDRAINEEVGRDPTFLDKCEYHAELMQQLFYSKGWTFTNCNGEDDKYKPEVKAIFKEIGRRMEEKFPGYLEGVEYEN